MGDLCSICGNEICCEKYLRFAGYRQEMRRSAQKHWRKLARKTRKAVKSTKQKVDEVTAAVEKLFV